MTPALVLYFDFTLAAHFFSTTDAIDLKMVARHVLMILYCLLLLIGFYFRMIYATQFCSPMLLINVVRKVLMYSLSYKL